MDEQQNVTEKLKELIDTYGFNTHTLSRYLELSIDDIERLASGNVDFLSDEPMYRFRIFNKIMFLYLSAIENKDMKLCAFLEVLISYHELSKETIAKMAGVEVHDIEKILSYPQKKVAEEIKCKVAVTVMALRFFLKDCEPKQ